MPKDTNLGKSLFRSNKKRYRKNKPVELGDTVSPKNDLPDTNIIDTKIVSSLVDHNCGIDELIFQKSFAANTIQPSQDNSFPLKSNDNVDFIFKRPKWSPEQSPEEVNNAERMAFNDYKRNIYSYQESNELEITPFEKNIEIWRQFWRVIEKSQIIFQIVDARNPLFYYSEELVRYIHEVDPLKKTILLINKSDLLSIEQIISWEAYFKSKNIEFIFYSALFDSKTDAAKTNLVETHEEISEQNEHDSESSEIVSDDKNKENISEESGHQNKLVEQNTSVNKKLFLTDRLDLISKLYEYKKSFKSTDKMTVGFIGCPNVGKSSTINNILGCKKTAVSFTPGKTKHLQTLYFDDNLIVCDCPGLVFPKFLSNKAELLLNGILHIDHVKDFAHAVDLLVTLIPRRAFVAFYQIDFPILSSDSNSNKDYCSSEELLLCISAHKNFIGSKNVPIFSMAAKLVLKDVVSGSLVYCTPPPNQDPFTFNNYHNISSIKPKENEQYDKLLKLLSSAKTDEQMIDNIDKQFFTMNTSNIHFKNIIGANGSALSNEEIQQNIHQLRKGRKKAKKEKLRRVFKEDT